MARSVQQFVAGCLRCPDSVSLTNRCLSSNRDVRVKVCSEHKQQRLGPGSANTPDDVSSVHGNGLFANRVAFSLNAARGTSLIRQLHAVGSISAVLSEPPEFFRDYSTVKRIIERDYGSGHGILYDTPQRGSATPFGAKATKDGVNFSIHSSSATSVSLCLFTEGDLHQGIVSTEVPLHPILNRTGSVWHVFLPALSPDLLYGYRIGGEFEPEKGLRFDNSKIVLDPYAKAVVGRRNYGVPGYNVDCWPQTAGTVPQEEEEEGAALESSSGGDGGSIWRDLVPTGAVLGLASMVAGANLEGPGSVLQAVGVLALIVTVHECGHFLAARLQNIHVTKFSIGFGPVLLRLRGEKVEYSLRAIPLGGFVAFPDDDPESQIPSTDPNLLKNRPILDRALVISAGVLANVVFAYTVLLTQVTTVGLLEQTFREGVAVPDVVADSVAERGGLMRGDVVVGVNGSALPADPNSVIALVDEIKMSRGRVVALEVQRGAELLTLDITPDATSDGSGRIGVQLAPNADTRRVRAAGAADAVGLASLEFGRLLATVTDGLQQIFFNFAQTADRVSGPVAIVAVGAEVARSDAAGLFQFAALVNINLAVVNILPLPALDGGYLALLLVEALRGGRKLPSGLEQGIMSSGILLLLGTGVLLMVRDTLTLSGML